MHRCMYGFEFKITSKQVYPKVQSKLSTQFESPDSYSDETLMSLRFFVKSNYKTVGHR